jgi:hypothetical protein
MRLSLIVALVAALTLPACQSIRALPGVEVPPPPSACAPVEDEPKRPSLTGDQLLKLDAAAIAALGLPLAQSFIRWADVDHPAWGRRNAARVEATRDNLCDLR